MEEVRVNGDRLLHKTAAAATRVDQISNGDRNGPPIGDPLNAMIGGWSGSQSALRGLRQPGFPVVGRTPPPRREVVPPGADQELQEPLRVCHRQREGLVSRTIAAGASAALAIPAGLDASDMKMLRQSPRAQFASQARPHPPGPAARAVRDIANLQLPEVVVELIEGGFFDREDRACLSQRVMADQGDVVAVVGAVTAGRAEEPRQLAGCCNLGPELLLQASPANRAAMLLARVAFGRAAGAEPQSSGQPVGREQLVEGFGQLTGLLRFSRRPRTVGKLSDDAVVKHYLTGEGSALFGGGFVTNERDVLFHAKIPSAIDTCGQNDRGYSDLSCWMSAPAPKYATGERQRQYQIRNNGKLMDARWNRNRDCENVGAF